jgi:hypothetical protein
MRVSNWVWVKVASPFYEIGFSKNQSQPREWAEVQKAGGIAGNGTLWRLGEEN